MAPVIDAIARSGDFQPIVISTGQHREMLQQVIDLFEIKVDADLQVMQPNQTLASLSARLLTAIDEVLDRLRPDLAVAQGDTTTSLISALASFYRRIPFAHVEAGLRTGDLASPFPEEANRRIASVVATLHFPPTELSRQNLLHEGVPDARIVVTGNTVIDALRMEVQRQDVPATRAAIEGRINGVLGSGWERKPYVLITGHRRENFGGGFDEICRAISTLARRFADHAFIYPVHLNPNVQKPVYETLSGLNNVKLILPQEYREFVALMRRCTLVLTDSGGIQEEAPTLGKPVLVMRDTTERPEGIDAGTVKLVGPHATAIIENVSRLLTDREEYRRMSEAKNPYGDGHAAGRILGAIRHYFSA